MEFQSALPMRAAMPDSKPGQPHLTVSIRAAHAGSDLAR